MHIRLSWLVLLLIANLAAPAMCMARPLAVEQHRVSVQVLDPAAAPVGHWQVKLHASYRPLVDGAPNTTETTTSRANCPPPPRYSLSILPSFERCTRTRERVVELKLPAAQIVAAEPKTLNLDFAPIIEDNGGTFRIDALVLDYMTCAKGCESTSLEIRLSCYADDVEPGEVLTDGLLLNYSRGAKAAAEVSACGLKAGNATYWASRDTVLARVRGHFGDDQQMVSNELLDAFTAIPGSDHRWQWNPAQGRGKFDESCSLPGNQSFVNSRYMANLPVAVGWPYRHTAEVYVASKPNGEVCSIWLTGTDDEMYLRYFYNFADGQLVNVSTRDEPDSISREWRWVNGQPWQYTHRQMPDSVAGHDTILYWHKTAAEQWPKRMDYTPDFKEFAALDELARQLLSQFPVKPQ